MRKIILLILLSFSVQSQTLIKPKQIAGDVAGSILTTTGTGVPTWTNTIPSSAIPTLSAYVPYTGATTSVNLGANSLSVGATSTVQSLYVPSTATVNGAFLVNSTIQITDGSQGFGKVLTSDANGLATWSTVSAGGSYVPYSGATGSVNLNDQDLGNVNTLVINRATGTNTIPLLVTDANCGGCQVDSESGIVLAKVSDDRAVNIHGFVNANAIQKTGTISSTSHNSYKDNSSFSGANAFGHHSSFENNFQFGGSATLGDAFGWYDKFNPSSGTTTNRIGFYCENAIGAGVLTNQYGIYIPSLTKGVNNYAIYVAASTPSHFKGNIQFSSGSGSAGAKTPTVGFYHGSANGQIISYFQSQWNGTNDKISFYNAKYSLAAWKEAFYIKGATTSNNLSDTVVVNSTNFKTFSGANYLGTSSTSSTQITGSLTVSQTFSAALTSSVNGLQLVSGGYSVTTKGINTTAGDAATINSPIGRFRKDNSGTTFVLTNSQITANSIITLQVVTAGLTGGKFLTVQAGAGTATITFEDITTGVAAAPSADMDVNFIIMN